MNDALISSHLASLTGNMIAAGKLEETKLGNIRQVIAGALVHQDPQTLQNRKFSFESTDFFARVNIPAKENEKLNIAVQKSRKDKEALKSMRVFIRDVPVRSVQVPGSIPIWAAGAALHETIGPVSSLDGRLKWIDTYRIVDQSVALYIQGQALPAIMFTGEFRVPGLLNPATQMQTSTGYSVVGGSVWIHAPLLSSSAPAGLYCGLKVKGGNVTLDQAPAYQNKQLVVPASDRVTVSLDLDQQVVPPSSHVHKHGMDARNAEFHLPPKFSFSFKGNDHSILEIDPASWKIYGQEAGFQWKGDQNSVFDPVLMKVLIPLSYSETSFQVSERDSPYLSLVGNAGIKEAYWGLMANQLDVNNPFDAYGSGDLIIRCGGGLSCTWTSVKGTPMQLVSPQILGEPGWIEIGDAISNALGANQSLDLWVDEQNPHGTSVDLGFRDKAPFIYISLNSGEEILFTTCNADFHNDRPVKVNGEPVTVSSKNSALMMLAGDSKNYIYLYDDNIIWDNSIPFGQVPPQKPIALDLDNALFTLSPVNGCLLFGSVDNDWQKVTNGFLWLVFGMYSYLPTLPDPYAANLGVMKRLYGMGGDFDPRRRSIHFWLAGLVTFKEIDASRDNVTVGFYFGGNQAAIAAAAVSSPASAGSQAVPMMDRRNPDYGSMWNERYGWIGKDTFALLDVSSNVNQFGISFNAFGERDFTMLKTADVVPSQEDTTVNNGLPIIVDGMEVKGRGICTRLFTLPEIAWEPVINLTPPDLPAPGGMDPAAGVNYYPNDGGPTRIFNNSRDFVTLAPEPMVRFLMDEFKANPKVKTYASFTLPFGLKALAIISKTGTETTKPKLQYNQPNFENSVGGGIQVSAIAGNHGLVNVDPTQSDGNMFPGTTLQLNNILDKDGLPTSTSSLGDDVTRIFNQEFFNPPSYLAGRPGVPVEKIDFSGYGASMFSNWLSPSATFAQTSQSRFDVLVGRTAFEVIQVKSILYPWGIRVVRTITLSRTSSGYVYRTDSGWKAETDGRFDFRYTITKNHVTTPVGSPYEIHPSTVKGLFNVRNIREDPGIAEFHFDKYKPGDKYIDATTGMEITVTDPAGIVEPVFCRGVWFDADVEIENVVKGGEKGRVVSKKILGYVQISPPGKPLTDQQLNLLLALQAGSIGGDLDCTIDINSLSGTGSSNKPLQMRVNRFDVSNSQDNSGNPLFVAAVRGNVLLPKEGSWSMVHHEVGTGNVTPMPDKASVPLIREGAMDKNTLKLPSPAGKLLRIANPMEIVRDAVAGTLNLGILQTTSTQKALFLTPSFQNGLTGLMSKTQPLFADAYRLMTGNGIFPNIGTALNGDFGKAVPLVTYDGAGNAINAFAQNGLQDAGTHVLELMEINPATVSSTVEQGMKLLKQVSQFDIPDTDIYLVNMDSFKIYIEYKTQDGSSPVNTKLDFDVNSVASSLADTCKSKLNNLSMVVDLGSMKRLMTIMGNFNSSKGVDSNYGGSSEGMPTPQIVFSKDMQPVIDLLQLLASLSTGDYAAVLNEGLKIAMSNSGEIWEYKFDAEKDIPMVRFPPTDELYNSPDTPLKLEASLGLGVYFSAALRETTDPSQLLPTAGGYMKFHGGLSVLCMSLGYGSIFATGAVDVKIACDTSVGPSLDLKFGFGAEIVVGLPVVGHVSLTFMVGVEMYSDVSCIRISAFLYFRGNAEILGGLVSVTITIEAKGTVERTSDETNCTAEVTFGLDISIFWIIDIDFSETWSETRQIA